DPATAQVVRNAATAIGAAVSFEGDTSFDWTPPAGQRDILERLKRRLDPDSRLAPLPWKAAPHEFSTSPG
ncbi:MAG TPA: hypothetical protein VMD30_08460, partial [Tepidisphaeraceae bacterium]|nr:hypothetical protein [Tepidisphaeraceae bacterium]